MPLTGVLYCDMKVFAAYQHDKTRDTCRYALIPWREGEHAACACPYCPTTVNWCGGVSGKSKSHRRRFFVPPPPRAPFVLPFPPGLSLLDGILCSMFGLLHPRFIFLVFVSPSSVVAG